MLKPPSLKIGIEEEYLIVDQESLDLVAKPDPEFMATCHKLSDGRTTNEYLQCQIEVGTRPHHLIRDAGRELADLRLLTRNTAEEYGYGIIASSTHPFATRREQSYTPKERYKILHRELGLSASRMLICGMHTHLEVEDEDLRIDLMNQAAYFLPHLLALSCSSPYWEGEDTSLASYRLAVFDALPRTGLPDNLNSFATFRRLVDQLVRSGSLEDGSKIWWDIRPSVKFPTIEQRITDVCSLLKDAVAITATFQAIVAYLYRLRTLNQRWRRYPPTLINENRWRAQRYGTDEPLIDHGKTMLVPFKDLLAELVELIREDAAGLGTEAELDRVKSISSRGNSTKRQRQRFAQAVAEGADKQEALREVARMLADDFLSECE
ncbi:MAG: carboxylate-amine ligase [Rhodobacteraceae bacterium]|nr:carboxylate-amine ligase [Paracoccaceae bacterium]